MAYLTHWGGCNPLPLHLSRERNTNIETQYKEGQVIGTDAQGMDVGIGDYIMKVNDNRRFQVRVRNGLLVKHFGGGYMELKASELKDYIKVWATDNEAALGMGAGLFNSKVIS